jgi:hypothetical protein
MAIGPALYSAPFTSISIIVAVAAIGGAAFYLGKFWDRPDSDERHFGIALVATAAMLFLTAVSWQPPLSDCLCCLRSCARGHSNAPPDQSAQERYLRGRLSRCLGALTSSRASVPNSSLVLSIQLRIRAPARSRSPESLPQSDRDLSAP